ncbi:MAG TPA: flocculation-associated PEP-CTERM protein PepA [Caldimonas sp.]|nr:flocculation-associated PEP-CTERM protein PepA [Caldimonas sp.]
MLTKFRLTPALVMGASTLAVATLAHGQAITDVLVRNGAGTTIANNVRSFDENEAGSGLAVGFAPTIGNTFSFLYQANVVAFNDSLGQTITPLAGLNQAFASGGYEFTVVARITEQVTGVSSSGGMTTATFAATGGTASIFFDNATSGGVKSVTSTGTGFDDGHLVGLFDVIAGTGVSNFTTFADGTGLGATKYDFNVRVGSTVDASYISGLLGAVGDLHFTSSQVLPPGTSLTTAFHTGAPTGSPDLYPTTPVGNGLLLKVDGSNTFTTAVPEPETYALMLAGLGAIGFMVRRRRR